MTKNLISATQDRISLFLNHLSKIKHFEGMTYAEQTELMYELRCDSVELNTLLDTLQTVYKQQKLTEVSQQ